MGLDWRLDLQHPFWQRFITALENDGSGLAAANLVYDERYAQDPSLTTTPADRTGGWFP